MFKSCLDTNYFILFKSVFLKLYDPWPSFEPEDVKGSFKKMCICQIPPHYHHKKHLGREKLNLISKGTIRLIQHLGNKLLDLPWNFRKFHFHSNILSNYSYVLFLKIKIITIPTCKKSRGGFTRRLNRL